MIAQEPHQMILSEMRTNGEEEWLCPTCGRRIMIAVSPSLTNPGVAIYVMVEGETEIAHTFAHENSQPEMVQPEQATYEADQIVERVKPLTEDEQLRLIPFIEWMETVDLNW